MADDFLVKLAAGTDDPVILDELSRSGDFMALQLVAQNVHASAETLDRLSRSDDFFIRSDVARNMNCPAEVLARLVHDEDSEVRWNACVNRNCPAEALDPMRKNGVVKAIDIFEWAFGKRR